MLFPKQILLLMGTVLVLNGTWIWTPVAWSQNSTQNPADSETAAAALPDFEQESPDQNPLSQIRYQDVAPLAPTSPLLPSSPNLPQSSGLFSPNTNFGSRLATRRRRLTSAPVMIGDSFGNGGRFEFIGNPEPIGPILGTAITVDEFSYLQGVDVQSGVGTPNGNVWAVSEFATRLVGIDTNGDNIIDTYGNLSQFDGSFSPVDEGPFIATANGQTLIDPTGVFDADIPARVFDIQAQNPIGPNTTPVINIPSPSAGGGGVLGRQKISENTSPMPRDRIFFNYSYFDNTPQLGGNVNVIRMTPGFEKTFFDGRTSFELRVPFASTLDTDITVDGFTDTSSLEFGNVIMAGKALVYTSEDLAVSVGLQMSLPTEDNVNVRDRFGMELARITNRSIHIAPFVGALYAPDEYFFVQGFVQMDFDSNGNPVEITDFLSGLQRVGRLNDTSFAYVDVGMGYWLYRANETDEQGVTGVVPTLELHYNRSMQSADAVTVANPRGIIQVGGDTGNVEALNVVVGTTFEYNYHSTLTVGFSTPIVGGSDREFDGEFRLIFNRRFGPQNRLTRPTF